MSLARYAKKRDANEADLVTALEAAGAVVYKLDRPVDLLVGWNGRWTLLEVKRPKGAVGDAQAAFMHLAGCKGLPAAIVRTAEDALHAIGAIR